MKLANLVYKSKIILIIIVLIGSLFLLTGCYDAKGLESLAYVIAIGIDEGTSNTLKLSLQFAVLGDKSSSGSSSGTSQSTSSKIVSVECSNFNSGIALLNSYLSKKINLSHCKVIVLSEDLAYNGISTYIFTFMNNVEIRPDCNIIISRCNAFDLLNNSKPSLESASARYYELILNSDEYTSYTQNVVLSDFYNSILNYTSQAYAILGGINTNNTHIPPSDSQTTYDLDSSYKADESPIETDTGIENMGLAVFNGDNLVGELNGIETVSHLIITNNLKNATINIPSPFNENSTVSLYIGLNKDTEKSVSLVNNFPYIKCKSYITANILSFDENLNYADKENLELLENYVSSYLENNIYSYLYKTSKHFNSDIVGFGEYAKKYYLTWEDWLNSSWLDNYQNSFFNVSVDTTLQSGYLFTKV